MIGVIGGSGFISSALVRALQQAGHEVRVTDRAPSRAYPDASIEADVRDREALRQACRGCDVLYDLAAEHRDDVGPGTIAREGLDSPQKCSSGRAAGERGRRWIFRSCSAGARRDEGHTGPVSGAVGFPDGARAISGSRDRTLCLRDLASGTSQALEGHSAPLYGAVVLADGARRVVVG
jgi:hypothetical protein